MTYLAGKPFVCPNCGAGLAYGDVNIKDPFRCPACKETLETSKAYMEVIKWSGMAVSLIISFRFALRHHSPLYLLLVGFPLMCVCFLIGIFIVKYILRPRIRQSRTTGVGWTA